MAFQLPSFGSLSRPTTLKRSSLFDGFPQFPWDEITDKEEIGRGSFGCVLTAKQRDGEVVVVKKLLRQHTIPSPFNSPSGTLPPFCKVPFRKIHFRKVPFCKVPFRFVSFRFAKYYKPYVNFSGCLLSFFVLFFVPTDPCTAPILKGSKGLFLKKL